MWNLRLWVMIASAPIKPPPNTGKHLHYIPGVIATDPLWFIDDHASLVLYKLVQQLPAI